MTGPQDPYSYPGGTDIPGGPVRRQGAQISSILAIVCGVLAILILPIVFGPIGIILAVVANRRGEPLWKIALGVSPSVAWCWASSWARSCCPTSGS
jgi:hypothetical protein